MSEQKVSIPYDLLREVYASLTGICHHDSRFFYAGLRHEEGLAKQLAEFIAEHDKDSVHSHE